MRFTKLTKPLRGMTVPEKRRELRLRLTLYFLACVCSFSSAFAIKWFYLDELSADAAAVLLGILGVSMLSIIPSTFRLYRSLGT